MALLDKKTIEVSEGVFFDVDPKLPDVLMRVGDKPGVRIRKSDLYSVCFIIADAEDQDKLTAIKQTEVQHFTRLHRIQLKKDMRKGEVLTTRCHISVPVAVVEGLKHIVERPKPRGGIPIIGAKK